MMKHLLKTYWLLVVCLLPIKALGYETITDQWSDSPDAWSFKYNYQSDCNSRVDPTDDNGRNWYETDFDDSSWTNYTQGPVANTDEIGLDESHRTNFTDDNGCFYLRGKLPVDLNTCTAGKFFLFVDVDDVAEIYLNGVQLSQEEVEAGASPYTFRRSDLNTTGDNILAIYYDNSGGGSGYLNLWLASMPVGHAQLSADGKTLTFVYDDQLGDPSNDFDINARYYDERRGEWFPLWNTTNSSITTIVFDPSFAACQPGNTVRWFRDMAAITTVEETGNLDLSQCDDTGEMFYNCKGLQSISLPSTMRTIGYNCFGYCSLPIWSR